MAKIEITAEELLAEARQRIDEISAEEAINRHGDGEVVFVDVRDENELDDGLIPGTEHVPRGMIEFKADPTSNYHNLAFDPDKQYVCYCAVGLRSAFVTDRLRRMGYDIVNLDGGIKAWRDAGGAVVPYEVATA
ncbi:rhodanese-like domain-containing protein [Natrinema sp. DC36]|uniref:rhodanese-like domain-containing protein n=1 Tax=Natrinema sp. DC36 TaxID=2878680 RepID=UPI001CF0AEA2|nr:rhodanese-like domain-containing protein [Natrinema sp. DC36]